MRFLSICLVTPPYIDFSPYLLGHKTYIGYLSLALWTSNVRFSFPSISWTEKMLVLIPSVFKPQKVLVWFPFTFWPDSRNGWCFPKPHNPKIHLSLYSAYFFLKHVHFSLLPKNTLLVALNLISKSQILFYNSNIYGNGYGQSFTLVKGITEFWNIVFVIC